MKSIILCLLVGVLAAHAACINPKDILQQKLIEVTQEISQVRDVFQNRKSSIESSINEKLNTKQEETLKILMDYLEALDAEVEKAATEAKKAGKDVGYCEKPFKNQIKNIEISVKSVLNNCRKANVGFADDLLHDVEEYIKVCHIILEKLDAAREKCVSDTIQDTEKCIAGEIFVGKFVYKKIVGQDKKFKEEELRAVGTALIEQWLCNNEGSRQVYQDAEKMKVNARECIEHEMSS